MRPDRRRAKVAVLAGAFINIPNREQFKVAWRCAFVGGEIANITIIVPVVRWPWDERGRPQPGSRKG